MFGWHQSFVRIWAVLEVELGHQERWANVGAFLVLVLFYAWHLASSHALTDNSDTASFRHSSNWITLSRVWSGRAFGYWCKDVRKNWSCPLAEDETEILEMSGISTEGWTNIMTDSSCLMLFSAHTPSRGVTAHLPWVLSSKGLQSSTQPQWQSRILDWCAREGPKTKMWQSVASINFDNVMADKSMFEQAWEVTV